MDILTAKVSEVAEGIRRGDVSSEQVVQTVLARMRELEPKINAVVAESPQAIDDARAADAELANGIVRGPLHGVPFTVKDVFDTRGFATAVDQRIRRRNTPSMDATAVWRLRDAGAILLAKSNCPPNGHGRDTENSVSGRTFNPYNLSRSPGGSSGGEAALIASGGSIVGLACDQSGGIRVPAHYCGVVGMKPTTGRIPNTGVYNQPGGLTDPRSQVGVLARSIDDIEYVLPLLCGPDDSDSGVAPVPWQASADVQVGELNVAFLIDDSDAPCTADVANAVGRVSQALSRHGVTVEPDSPADFIGMARELDYYWQDMPGTTGRTMVEVYSIWDDYRSQMLVFMDRYDAILCPAAPLVAPPYQERDPQRFSYTIPFNLTGYPALVVRVGQSQEGLPIGVQVAARPWREDVALALGRLLEHEFGGWKPLAE